MRRIAVALLVIGLGAAGCGDDGGDVGVGAGADVILTIYVADESVAEWTLAELEAQLVFVTVELDGDEQNGPRVLDVIAASGVTDWRTAEILGKGEGRAFDIGIEATNVEIDDAWLFDITNRGTLKLAAPDLPREQWVRDAGEIRIP